MDALLAVDPMKAKRQFFYVLGKVLEYGSPYRVRQYRKRLRDGEIQGKAYIYLAGWEVNDDDEVARDCGCALGTALIVLGAIEKFGNSGIDAIAEKYELFLDPESDLETLVFSISYGDTPQTNIVSTLLLSWIEEFMSIHGIK